MRSMRIKYPRFTSFDTAAANQQDHYKIDAIAMSAFWCRPANPTSGVNAKLVSFYEPRACRLDLREQLTKCGQQTCPQRVGGH